MSTIKIIRQTVLDHGYVEVVESWGSDERIIASARMSTLKGFLGWGPVVDDSAKCRTCGGDGEADDRGFRLTGQPYFDTQPCSSCGGDGLARKTGDEKLLRFLYEHKHSTPFEFAGLTIEVQAPIFVFREWHRHRTQSYTEASARYAPLPNLNYVPTVERLMIGTVGKNKQAGGTGAALTLKSAGDYIHNLELGYAAIQEDYDDALEKGVPKELARLILPVGRYSKMRASTNLRNWLAFLTLRMDAAAQWEIRQYANAVGAIIADRFPRTWELFAEGAK